MKKLVFIFLVISSFIFSSCDFLDKLLNLDELEDERITLDNNGLGYEGNVFLFKYNLSKTKVEDKNTGYISENFDKVTDNIINKSIYKDEFEYSYTDVSDFQNKQWEYISNIKTDNFTPDSYASITKNNSDEKKFNLFSKISNPNSDILVTSYQDSSLFKMYEGSHCIVYYSSKLDSDYAKTQDFKSKLNQKNSFKTIADTFDSIYTLETSILGSNQYYINNNDSKYVNTDSKVSILILDIDGDAIANQNLLTLGLYVPGDLIKNKYMKSSNEEQILYLDSYSLYNYENKIKSTLVHEFNHLLNDINKVIKSNGKVSGMSTWFTEMLSMLAEDMFCKKLNISFNDSPRSRLLRLQYKYYLGFTTWFKEEEQLSSYCNSFAYGSFIVRNYGGFNLLKQIATNEYIDEEAIQKAFKACGKNISFDESVKNYYKSLYNVSTTGLTMNKSVSNSNGLYFPAIDFNNINGEGTSIFVSYFDYDEQVDLYPQGCSIHYIGDDLDSFTLNKKVLSDIEYEIVCF